MSIPKTNLGPTVARPKYQYLANKNNNCNDDLSQITAVMRIFLLLPIAYWRDGRVNYWHLMPD